MVFAGKLRICLQAWPVNRTQNVVLEGCSSTEAKVLSGVRQGDCSWTRMLPTLGKLHASNISLHLKLFANNTLLYAVIHSQADALSLQSGLDQLVAWSQIWQIHFLPALIAICCVFIDRKTPLPINIPFFKKILFAWNNNTYKYKFFYLFIYHQYTMLNQILEVVDHT